PKCNSFHFCKHGMSDELDFNGEVQHRKPLWKPCACTATIAESKYKARLRQEPGLYFVFISSEQREERTIETDTDLPWATAPSRQRRSEWLDPGPHIPCAV